MKIGKFKLNLWLTTMNWLLDDQDFRLRSIKAKMQLLVGVLCVLAGLLLSTSATRAQAYSEDAYWQPMQFFTASAGNAIEATWIAAVGRIDSETPDRFIEFIESEGTEGGKIVLHSPGGSLVAGLRLGYLIRKFGLATAVGRTVLDPENPDSIFQAMESGDCASSCAYAFLGGLRRDLFIPWAEDAHGSRLGFHQFYRRSVIADVLPPAAAAELEASTLSSAQFIAGLIAAYSTRCATGGWGSRGRGSVGRDGPEDHQAGFPKLHMMPAWLLDLSHRRAPGDRHLRRVPIPRPVPRLLQHSSRWARTDHDRRWAGQG